MHPAMLHRKYLSERKPDDLAHRERAKASGGVLRGWLRATILQWQRRKMTARLQALDDRLLADIGMLRTDIPRAVDGITDRELHVVPLTPAAAPAVDDGDGYLRAA